MSNSNAVITSVLLYTVLYDDSTIGEVYSFELL